MKKILMIILVSIGCFILILGCAGKNTIEKQKKLMTMSDRELINYYKMIEMRMIDIERAKEQSIVQEQYIYNRYYSEKYYNHLGHLHIGDNWYELKKEKNLTLIEMRNRGISPP